MKAKYIGDPRNPGEASNLPESTEAFGIVFERGKWVEVPENLAPKFEGNTHFETRGEAPEPEPDNDTLRAAGIQPAKPVKP